MVLWTVTRVVNVWFLKCLWHQLHEILVVLVNQNSIHCEDFLIKSYFTSGHNGLGIWELSCIFPVSWFSKTMKRCLDILLFDLKPRLLCLTILIVLGPIFSTVALMLLNPWQFWSWGINEAIITLLVGSLYWLLIFLWIPFPHGYGIVDSTQRHTYDVSDAFRINLFKKSYTVFLWCHFYDIPENYTLCIVQLL